MASFDETSENSPPPIEISVGCCGGGSGGSGGETLYGVLRDLISAIASPPASPSPPQPAMKRVRDSLCNTAPRFRDATANAARDLMAWTRRGSPLRALLVVSVGTMALLALTGLLVFMLFFLAATVNAIIISFLMSLAAAGGFLALFFASLTAIYVGALFVAVFVISTITISTIAAVTIATGWVGFFWIIWLTAKKSMDLSVQSVTLANSAFSSFSAGRRAMRYVSLKSSGSK